MELTGTERSVSQRCATQTNAMETQGKRKSSETYQEIEQVIETPKATRHVFEHMILHLIAGESTLFRKTNNAKK